MVHFQHTAITYRAMMTSKRLKPFTPPTPRRASYLLRMSRSSNNTQYKIENQVKQDKEPQNSHQSAELPGENLANKPRH